MKIHGLQIDIAWEDRESNHDKVMRMLDRIRPEPGSLIVLPEMFASGFSMDVQAIHDTATHETENFLKATASVYGVYLIAGLVTRLSDGRGLNESVAFNPAGVEIARYAKLHPFTMGGEATHYKAGDSTCIFPCEEFTVASFICYDLRFPEVFRTAVTRGANLYTVIANWPVTREDHWVTLLRARAIENQAFVIGVNRCGLDPFLEYPGRSMIIDPSGSILADAGRIETSINAEIDLEDLITFRRKLPFLDDLRSDYVASESQRRS